MHISPSRGTKVRDSGVSPVLEYPEGTSSSCIPYTLRFSALASCFALPPASMQSCARCFLALTKKLLFLDAPIKLSLYCLFGLFITTSCYGQNDENQSNAVQTETIKLNYRLAEEVIPLLKPFLHEKGIMTGQGQRILIKTSATNLAEIKQFISDIDVPLQSLLITVTIDYELVKTQNNRVKRYSTEKRNTGPSTQQIQTLEGQWATINTGELVPVGQEKRRQGGTIAYKSVTSGFQARARLHGKQVTIELRPKLHSKSRQGGGRINTQEADTTVFGQLGEWIKVGGVSTAKKLKKDVRTYTTGRRDENQNQIYVKVDVQK